ncbi:MAG: ATP-binding protein [Candidatus Methylomirabilales bacterium]
MIQLLQAELAQTNREVTALTLELETRVEERTAELRAAQDELQRTNSELLQLTLELEERVAQRTAELASANASLRAEIARRREVEEEIRRLNTELERRVQERTADLAAANKELESFAYSVSHDLRAPLRGINGWSQALAEDYGDVLDEQGRTYLETVRAETRRMGELIDALLGLSRVSRAEMQRQAVDLGALARDVERDLRRAEPERRVEFVIAPGLAVHGDPSLLRAVLHNLLGNAWKFTAHRPDARIELGVSHADGRPVYWVRDNGAGFDMAYAGKLFAPFQRLHRQDEYPGTGIGLATVQRIVHRHGGRIWAEGEVGKGATLFFTL